MTTGKLAAPLFMVFMVWAGMASHAAAQSGPEMRDWSAQNKPGDGVVEVVLTDGSTPMSCRLEISVKGGPGCTKVMCKGEQVVMTSSAQSVLAAKKIALSQAKAHYTHFLQEEINSKRVTETIDTAIANEGGQTPGTQTSSGYVSSSTVREQASALIKGFAVIEDGFESLGNQQVAYVIGGVSCLTQRAADNMNAGNRRDNAAYGNSGSAGGPANAMMTPMRRRAGVDQM